MIPKLVVEFIGTFFLVFTVGQTVLGPNDAGAFAPLAIGSALMVAIYAGGHVSGGHYNPAVTLGVAIRGKCSWAAVPGYMIAQVVGGVAAAVLVTFLKGADVAFPPPGPAYSVLAKLIVEFLFTFLLVFTVLNTATARGTAGNSFYGLAIGFSVVVGAYAVGGISGAAFNPAVAVGVTAMGLSKMADLWVLLAADFAGGLVAGLLFQGLKLGGDEAAA